MTTKTESFISSKPVNTSLLNDQLVDMAFITEFTGMTDKWFYKLISEGKFPKPIKPGRSSHWKVSEVEIWMQESVMESGGK
ncbi:hypothetical protein F384_13045 [Citrobacter amalonaticus Y19]|uniref:Rha family transcriptional regulator n=1 Tax=Citrobacter amalonaticus Y19 TaxID=1261127 RepID=A0A0F6TVL6_CITAM|nr:AlpA family phage regulatory protein [Citrobacter amalonaticus]AKE59417.1 hypothetical protein F384_13045 [Citrobacter amalonaticus Y19]